MPFAPRAPRRIAGLRAALILAPAVLGGCDNAFGDRDLRSPGEPLGTFHVVGTRTANDCGEGALGAITPWEFDIQLSREASALYWNNGGAGVTGTLDADGVTFHFDASIAMDMRAPGEAELPPCTMSRRDRGAGVLDAPEGATSFKGSLRYDFAPTAGSSCDDLVHGPEAIVAQLPCGFSYAIDAKLADAE